MPAASEAAPAGQTERQATVAALTARRQSLTAADSTLSSRLNGVDPGTDVQVYGSLLDIRFETEAIGLRLNSLEGGGPFRPPSTAQAAALQQAEQALADLITANADTSTILTAVTKLLATYGAADSQP